MAIASIEYSTTGTVIGTVSATDPDSGDSATYALIEDAGGRFAIDATSGEITVLDSALLDHEAASSHDILVQVTDSGGLTYSEWFTITVGDVDTAPGDEVIYGDAGDNLLIGTSGNDTINGLAGNDTLEGGAGGRAS